MYSKYVQAYKARKNIHNGQKVDASAHTHMHTHAHTCTHMHTCVKARYVAAAAPTSRRCIVVRSAPRV
jgi:hypothetical protein